MRATEAKGAIRKEKLISSLSAEKAFQKLTPRQIKKVVKLNNASKSKK
jgi:hypothetical protein